MKKNTVMFKYFLVISIALFSCQPMVNIEQSKQEILDADQEFSNYSVTNGMNEAFYAFADDSAVILRKNSYPIVGKEQIQKLFSKRNDSLFTLSWQPSFVDVANSGDLGYTYGIYKLKTADTIMQGTYVSIWKKGADSKWKYVFDSGNQGLGKN
ncbi:MAG: hypothetical protein N4A59_15145 [Marinifilum sp.]|jgi:ketosteroid isomerase-like protein|nr:hypothetical protein [Marinifilum sp.]